MAKKIKAFVAKDGMVFLNEAECDAYDARKTRTTRINELINKLADNGAHADDLVRLVTPILVEHADDFITALTIVPEVRRGRKPKSEAASVVLDREQATDTASCEPTTTTNIATAA